MCNPLEKIILADWQLFLVITYHYYLLTRCATNYAVCALFARAIW